MNKNLLMAAVGMMFVVAGGASAAELVKVASFVSPKSIGVTKVIKPWMEKVRADIGSSAELKGFWGGSLGKSPVKQYELVKNGVADVAWILPGYTAGQFPEMQIVELPFLVDNANEAGLVVQRLHDAGHQTGLGAVKLLGAWATSPNLLFINKPVKSVADLKNLKIRNAGSVGGYWLGQMGAIPQTMSAPKMTVALNRGTIDGGQQGWTGMRTFKAMGLVTHAMDLPLGAIPFFLGMNKKKWDGLPKNVQAAFLKHGGETIARNGGKAYTDAVTQILSKNAQAKKLTIVKPSGPEFDKLVANSKKTVHSWWINKTKNGQEVYNKAVKFLADIRKNG